jgi:membrane peptidoglycan carboxypeptidase
MGYQVSVTPLQMAAAASAVANGGLLLEPHVVRAVDRGGRVEPVAPKVLHRAIAPETARTLTAIMEAVVEYGTAKLLRIPGYRVAGKTGTSHKAIPGGYSRTDYNASFVGFVPADDPRFTILVVIDTPRAGSHYGASVAGPVFRAIAEAALVHAGVSPTVDPEPPVLVRVNQPLLPVEQPDEPTVVAALASTGSSALMPDLRGMSGREAVRALTSLGVSVRSMRGSGVVVRQHPEPGSPVDAAGSSSLELRAAIADAPLEAAP